MNHKLLFSAVLLISTLCMNAKNALVVISHGSPMEEWRKPVLDLEPLLQKRVSELKLNISYVRVAMMEFTEPTIATVVSDCEAQGIDTIFAIPLFIAPSSHSDEDIPNIIGHKFNASTIAELNEEGTKLVHTRIPIILGPTLSYNNVIEEIMLKNVKDMSKSPEDEALLFVSHGDKQWTSFWTKKMESIADTCRKSTGIKEVDYKFVAMGYKMVREIIPTLKQWSQNKKRILIQGVYLTSTAKEIADASGVTEMVNKELNNPNVEVVYSNEGILPSSTETVVDWILDRTKEWLQP